MVRAFSNSARADWRSVAAAFGHFHLGLALCQVACEPISMAAAWAARVVRPSSAPAALSIAPRAAQLRSTDEKRRVKRPGRGSGFVAAARLIPTGLGFGHARAQVACAPATQPPHRPSFRPLCASRPPPAHTVPDQNPIGYRIAAIW